jgi:hypothetical protein
MQSCFLVKSLAVALMLSAMSMFSAAPAEAQDSGCSPFCPGEYVWSPKDEAWALIEVQGFGGIGINWRSFDRFGDNLRIIDAAQVAQTKIDNIEYILLTVVFDCNQQRTNTVRWESYDVAGSQLEAFGGSGEWWPLEGGLAIWSGVSDILCATDTPQLSNQFFPSVEALLEHIRTSPPA